MAPPAAERFDPDPSGDLRLHHRPVFLEGRICADLPDPDPLLHRRSACEVGTITRSAQSAFSSGLRWLGELDLGPCVHRRLQVGRAAARVIRIRPDLLTGVALVVMAGVLGPRA